MIILINTGTTKNFIQEVIITNPIIRDIIIQEPIILNIIIQTLIDTITIPPGITHINIIHTKADTMKNITIQDTDFILG